MKLTNKRDRIAVCRIVRDGKTADQVRAMFVQQDTQGEADL